MPENPYESPQTTSLVTKSLRQRLGFGNLIFVSLGLVFILLPSAVLVSTFNDSALLLRMSSTLILLGAVGIALTTHGLVRSNTTMGAVVVSLLIFIWGLTLAIAS